MWPVAGTGTATVTATARANITVTTMMSDSTSTSSSVRSVSDNSLATALILSQQRHTSSQRVVKAYAKLTHAQSSVSASDPGARLRRKHGDKHGGVTNVRKAMFERRTCISRIATELVHRCCAKECTWQAVTITQIQKERIRLGKMTTKEYQDDLTTTLTTSMQNQVRETSACTEFIHPPVSIDQPAGCCNIIRVCVFGCLRMWLCVRMCS